MKLGYLALVLVLSLHSCQVSYSSRYISNEGAYIDDLHFINDTTFCFDWFREEHFSPRLCSSGRTVGNWHKKGRTIWLQSERQPNDFVSVLEVTDSNSISDSMTITFIYNDTIGTAECVIFYFEDKENVFDYVIAGRSGKLSINDTVVLRIEKPRAPNNQISFADQYGDNDIVNNPFFSEAGKFPDAFSVTLVNGSYRYFTQQKVKMRRQSIVIIKPRKNGGRLKLTKCYPTLP